MKMLGKDSKKRTIKTKARNNAVKVVGPTLKFYKPVLKNV